MLGSRKKVRRKIFIEREFFREREEKLRRKEKIVLTCRLASERITDTRLHVFSHITRFSKKE